MKHVVLDPDGTVDYGLVVIVEADTKVTYHQQCAGLLTEARSVEGFLIPVAGRVAAQKIFDWFWSEFKGNCYPSQFSTLWTQERTARLGELVAEIPCWHFDGGVRDKRDGLRLDTEIMHECVEAWIPVVTPYGRGILALRNSD